MKFSFPRDLYDVHNPFILFCYYQAFLSKWKTIKGSSIHQSVHSNEHVVTTYNLKEGTQRLHSKNQNGKILNEWRFVQISLEIVVWVWWPAQICTLRLVEGYTITHLSTFWPLVSDPYRCKLITDLSFTNLFHLKEQH